ncbi:N [Farmington virus]|uniref:N n=1 Tax=Farmington virus TaxID=1027468 RepID=UPI000387A9C0|nr:N [Farmington virus] [Farmington virus]AGN91187.1 N [Farmington virus] [Farmington virus]
MARPLAAAQHLITERHSLQATLSRASKTRAEEFVKDFYLQEQYSVPTIPTDDIAQSGPMLLQAILSEEYTKATDIAQSILWNTPTPNGLLREHLDADGGGSFTALPASAIRPSDEANAWAARISDSGLGPVFYAALAAYIIGWSGRGETSRVQQNIGQKWLMNLNAIFGTTITHPTTVRLPINVVNNSLAVRNGLAATLWLYYRSSPQSQDAFFYGLIRPCCSGYLGLLHRVQEIDEMEPDFLSDPRIIQVNEVYSALRALVQLGNDFKTADDEPMQVWACRGINNGYLTYLSETPAKKGAVVLMFAQCMLKGDSEAWNSYRTATWVMPYCDNVALGAMAGYIQARQNTRAYEVSAQTGLDVNMAAVKDFEASSKPKAAPISLIPRPADVASRTSERPSIPEVDSDEELGGM